MSMYDKLKGLIPGLADDGSKELAKQWLDLIKDSTEAQSLLADPAFQRLILQMRRDFKERILAIVDKDPELKAMHRMFVRTVGLAGATDQIERSINELVERSEEGQAS